MTTNKYYFKQTDANAGAPLPMKALDMGDTTYAHVMGRYAVVVSPIDQASVTAYADVVGSTLDSLYNYSVSYTILNNGANTIKWQVLAANLSDFSDVQTVKVEATVAASALDTYSSGPAVYRYYKVQIKDSVGGNHGQSHVGGIAKG